MQSAVPPVALFNIERDIPGSGTIMVIPQGDQSYSCHLITGYQR